MKPLVSFIALNFNHSKFLLETLDSIKNQKANVDYEIIITDDGSQDNSVEIISEWVAQNKNAIIIKTLFNEVNIGLCKTLNLAIELAKGQWIKPISCDDILEQNYLNSVLNIVNSDDIIGLVCTDMSHIKSDGSKIRESNWKYNQTEISNEIVNDFNNLFKGQYLNAPTLFYKKEVWMQLVGYDETLIFEDWDFLLRAKKITKFAAIKESLVRYRLHDSNMHLNFKTSEKYIIDSIKLLKKHLNESSKSVIREKVIEEISNLIPINEKEALTIWEHEFSWLKSEEKNQPLVSILLPVYNAEKYIETALKSVLLQTYTNIEIIIINDGSSDNSHNIISKLAESNHVIKYYCNEVNQGLIGALNFGLDKCINGCFVARMDADDICSPNRIEIQIRELLDNPDLAAVSSWMCSFGTNTRKKTIKYRTNIEEIKAVLPFYSPISHPAAIFKSEIIKQFNYREGYKGAEDYDLWFRLLQSHQVGILPKTLHFYRIHLEQITNQKNLDSTNESQKKIAQNLLDYFNIKETNDAINFHVKFCMNNGKFKTGSDFLKWDEHLIKFLNKEKELLNDKVFKNFVFKNYWQNAFFTIFKKLTLFELFKVLSSPFCKFYKYEKYKFLVKKVFLRP